MWYQLQNESEVCSPGLLFYKERIIENIGRMIAMAGSPDRLIPHVKTHKTRELVLLQLEQGITKFKCATIAEAEMIASCGGKWILIAYQMVGPNLDRLSQLKQQYPDAFIASLIDDMDAAKALNTVSEKYKLEAPIYIDINVGMNRTGHKPDDSLPAFIDKLSQLPQLAVDGLHIYDGQIHTPDYSERKTLTDSTYETALPIIDYVLAKIGPHIKVVAGGSPTFNIHNLKPQVYLSPGTNVLWDAGYDESFKDQSYLTSALILTRVISKPTENIVTLDLGHKAIAAENPIDRRLRILNMPSYELLSQSEEHGVLRVPSDVWQQISVGDTYYVVPFHVCPSVALHEFASIVEYGTVRQEWKIIARSRRITI
ncbi:D-serine deaminase-like pyridoxal phosphate-dependent protein [Dyadobacter jejuensis]|uniref:D-serine deaminase-like pyridoxal phosphate-dependent protein n=1 Tax=Dyadobacter jejuensis TaxID=1082580 RepID=A0A316B8T2_9BACT|nr:D-TA family PLP-dependent enzyme [Dyadobacter jejuensis]PWJ58937.1 D-serine deaminase-like pyridoxal phosphate-dependent protein [Dyadobacter jejuensis]